MKFMSKYATTQKSLNVKKESDNRTMLKNLHLTMVQLPILIRDHICNECNWSIATFYRKARLVPTKQPSISNAEKEKILDIIYRLLTRQAEQIKSLQKR